MRRDRFKRFYAEAAAEKTGDGFRVLLDRRPIRTPAGAELCLPSRALAETIAAEWQAQAEEVDPRALVLTGLASTALDVVGTDRQRVIDDLVAYGGHDLVCYRAEGPAQLVARQLAVWQPLVDWAALALDAPLAVTAGVVPVAQPQATLEALRAVVARRDAFELAALGAAVLASGSLVIGLALCAGLIDAEAAFQAGQLDETYQSKVWGEDPETLRRRAAIRGELEAAARFLALLRDRESL